MHKELNSVQSVTSVILNWRDPRNTQKCVELLAQNPQISKIILVHNESNVDVSLPLNLPVHLPEVIEIHVEENRGFSAGVNEGLRFALKIDNSPILLINNDAYLTLGSLEKLLNALEQKNTSIAAPTIRNPDLSLQSSGVSINQKSLSTDETCDLNPDFLTFACVLINSSTFEKVGLLDEAFFMYWEDVDFGLRVKAAGLDLVVVPEATAIHAVSSSRKIAGSRVDLYSAFGLGAFGVLHPQYKFGSYFRITLRVLKRVALLRFSFSYKLWKAFRDGQKLDRPSYLKVTKENWPL